jgi:dienelactone hydrolase
LIWVPDQLEDWSAAIDYARGLKEIDPTRIALWGTSFSGGHVIVTAAKDHRIACVSAQCPGLDGRASIVMAFKREGFNFRMIMHAQRDLVRSWFGLSPHKVPIVGKPGTIALMTTAGAYDTFEKLAPDNFVNEACARIIIRGDKYRPVKQARNVQCPVLLQICEYDDLTPISAAEETAELLGEYAEVKHYAIGHFDIYLGENFEKSVSDQLEFFKSNL